jgi:hypothetical protein
LTEEPEITKSRARLELLERRRLQVDATLWQIPGLTVAGQAFLLQVLVNTNTSDGTAWLAAAAGIAAVVATALALGNQVASERRLNREVATLACEEGLGKTGSGRDFWGEKYKLPEARAWGMWLAFLAVLALLAVADGFALAHNLSH